MALEQAIKDALKKAKDSPEDLKELFSIVGIKVDLPVPEQSDDKGVMKKWFDDLKAVLEKKVETPQSKDVADSPLFKSLLTEIEFLKTAFGEEKKAREESTKALQDKLQQENEKKVNEYVEAMIADGRLAPKDDDKKKLYTELLSGDFDKQKMIFDSLPKNPALEKKTGGVAPVKTALGQPADKLEAYMQMQDAAKAEIAGMVTSN